MSPNLSDNPSRNLVSFAAILGGSALAYLSGGVSAVVGATVASLFVNVATTDADKAWESHRRHSKYPNRNRDLTKLVGSAISRTLHACAKSRGHEPCAKWLEALANVAEHKYEALAVCPSLEAINSVRLPALFAQAGQAETRSIPLLDERYLIEGKEQSVAYGLIGELRDSAGVERIVRCHKVAERYLIRNLFSAIREMCKRAFEGHDRSYGALLLDTVGTCLGGLSQLGKDQVEIMERLRLTDSQTTAFQQQVVRSIQSLASQVEEVDANIATALLAEIKNTSRFFPEVDAKLEQVMGAITSNRAAIAAAINNSNQTILAGLDRTALEVGKMLDVSSTLSRLRETRFNNIRIAFLKTVDDLVAEAKSEHLKRASNAARQWLSIPITFDQCEQILRRAFQFTAESELRSTESKFGTRLVDYLHNAEEDQPIATMFACTLLRMERPDDKMVPEYLLKRLEIEDVHHQFFGQYLHRLHEYLKGEIGFAEVIDFAEQLNATGLIDVYSEKLAKQFARVDRTKQWLGSETRGRQLGRDFNLGLDNYVRYLSEAQLPFSPLAFIAPRVGFPSEIHIKEIYEPVSVRSSADGQSVTTSTRLTTGRDAELADRLHRDASSAKSSKDTGGDLDSPPVGSILSASGSLVILGPPGIGKSTLMRRIALALSEASPNDIPGWTESNVAIPIFVRLKGFAEFLHKRPGEYIDPCHGSMVSYLDHFYRVQSRMDLPPRFFDVLLEFGGCACFLDGFDEIGTSQREVIAGHLTEFIQYYRRNSSQGLHAERLGRVHQTDNLFVMTSREKGFEAAEVPFRPVGFSIAHVTPLTPNGISRLLKRLLKHLDKGDEDQINRDFSKLSREILKKGDLTTLAGIPLFCTSMVLIYEHLGKELPPQKFDILEELVKLLLGYWDILDNKGRTHWSDEEPAIEVNVVVSKKWKRLSHIAYNMQIREDRTRIELDDAVRILTDYLREREEGPSEEYFKRSAERFIHQSHDRSNLLVETESTETSSVYEFIHEMFREFFTADWVATSRSQEFQKLIRQHIDDSSWEQVLLLATSHARTRESDDTCHDIIDTCLDLAEESASNGDSVKRAGRLSMTARMARGFVSTLTNPYKKKLRQTIVEAMSDVATPVTHRLDIANQLSMLGWLEGDLYTFALVELSGGASVFIGRGLVANQSYERFLNSDEYNDSDLWTTAYCTSLDGRPVDICKSSLLSLNSLKGESRFPKGWNDPQLGIDNRMAPVVGVNWYEANAYCAWLLRYWSDLPESRSNPGIVPYRIRLPREEEWIQAVFGCLRPRPLPWSEMSPAVHLELSDVEGRANVGNLLTRTTPVGMFPNGRSIPSGLLDSLGNAWEWQANWFDYSYRGISLRGGSYSTSLEQIKPNMRGVLPPDRRVKDVGFRILIECESSTNIT